MKKFIFLIAIIASMWQVAGAQPVGHEIVWVYKSYGTCAKFTSDDKYIVSNGSRAQYSDSLLIIETATGNVVRRCYVPSVRNAIRISNNDSLIYCNGDDGYIYVYNFCDLKLIKKLDKIRGGSDFFDLSKDNKTIVNMLYAPERKYMAVYDVINDSLILTLNSSGLKPKFFSNDMKLAIASYTSIFIYDTKTWEVIKETKPFVGHTTPILDFDISEDETRIVTCAEDGKIIVWDLETGEKIDEIFIKEGLLTVKFLTNNDLIMFGGGIGHKSTIIDFRTKELLYRNNSIYSSHGIELSNNKEKILSIDGLYCVLIDFKLANATKENTAPTEVLFPNPVDSNINIDILLNFPSKTHYEISDISGNIIKKEPIGYLESGNQKISIDVSSLQTGMYYLKLQTDFDALTFKFIVER